MRDDVLCGQMNLQKGTGSSTNLLSYLKTGLQTGTQTLFGSSQRGGAQDKRGNKINSFLLFLQEPATMPNRVVGLGTGNNLFYDKKCERTRTAIFASRDLHIWPVEEFTTKDLTVCIWLKEGKEVYVISAYFDILLDRVVPEALDRVLDHCEIQRKEVIICADTNSHSSLWNCPDTNRRGEILEEWVFRRNLKIQNNGAHHTFHRKNAHTIIDVTFTKGPFIGKEVADWEVTEAVLGSDHLLIQWRITISSIKRKAFRNWLKGDWLAFQVCLDEISSYRRTLQRSTWTKETLDSAVEEFTNDVQEGLDETHPVYRPRPKIAGIPHFDAELIRWKKKVRACYSNYRMHRTEFTFEQFRDARRVYKSKIKRAKKKAWQTFCEDADDAKKASHVYRVIQGRVNQTLGLMKKDDGTLCTSPGISLMHVVDTHFPGNRLCAPEEVETNRSVSIHSNDAAFITENSVADAIQTFGKNKAAGPDGLPPCVFQHFGEISILRLTILYKASYLLGYVPKLWRRAKVIFIPKPGKKDYTLPRSFRPITLSSFMIKILERVILWHLNDNHLKTVPLSDNQHAFRGGRNTETALTNLVSQIEGSLDKKEYALGVFLDIQGAFDNVGMAAIRDGMEAKNLPSNLVEWYCHYIGNRCMTVDHNGTKVKRYLVRGTPQGGVLSPVMWNLAFDLLLEKFRTGRVKIHGFADDAALIRTGNNPGEMMASIQNAVNMALDWGTRCDLKFSPEKTEVMLFTRRTKPQIPHELVMNGKNIPFTNKVRYLGVYLDPQLSWKNHVETKVKAAKQKLLRIKNAMGKLWGVRPLISRWIYTGVVRPALSYAALVWAKACERKGIITLLTKVNRIALMSISYFRRSTPTAGLEVIFQVLPLHIHVQYEACLAMNRTQFTLQSDGSHTLRQVVEGGHRDFCMKIMDKINLNMIESDRMIPTFVWRKPYKFDRLSLKEGKPNPCDPGTYEVYTDGSGQDDKFGSGVAIYKGSANPIGLLDTMTFHLGEESSVFQGEVYAIKAAAHWIKDNLMNKTIVIYSDSRAALMALDNTKVKSKLVLSTQHALIRAGDVNTIILRWVKAHKGHEGNEKADTLAKAGTVTQDICDGAPHIPESMVKMRFKNKFQCLWQEYWTNRPDCRQTKQWLPRISKKISFDILKLNRKEISWAVQLITGHNFMKRHESLVNSNDESECRLCLEDDETSHHIMAACPALARVRLEVLGSPFLDTPLHWSIKKVSSFVRKASIGYLLDPAEIYGIVE